MLRERAIFTQNILYVAPDRQPTVEYNLIYRRVSAIDVPLSQLAACKKQFTFH